VSLSKKAL